MKLYRVTHTTLYRYTQTVHGSLNEVRIQPRLLPHQRVSDFVMRVEPEVRYRSEAMDAFGNHVSILDIDRHHLELQITSVAEVACVPVGHDKLDCSVFSLRDVRARLRRQTTSAALEARCLAQTSPLLPAWPELPEQLGLSDVDLDALTVAEFGRLLSRAIFEQFEYRPGHTEVSTPLQKVLHDRVGVCQDFAHLAIVCARARGIPARYVSGYMETLPPPGVERLIGADATHAWFALYDPKCGWLEFDPTNDTIPDYRYITIGWGRDYSDVAPIRGVVRGGGIGHELSVAVDVERLIDS
jgi:transglutaminase-like putative cysteine protease